MIQRAYQKMKSLFPENYPYMLIEVRNRKYIDGSYER